MTLTCRFMALFFFLLAACAGAAPPFQKVGPGLEYRQLSLASPRPLVMSQLRCDPKLVRFSLLLASDRKGNKGRVARADDMLKSFKLSAVINCSYFDDNEKVIGFHERLGHVLSSEVAAGGVFGGFFFWDGKRAGLKARDEARPSGVPVLFQAGPRLVWDGETIAGLDDRDLAARSGVSIDSDGKVTLFALGLTSPTSLAELPEILKAPVSEGGLGSWRALNFDGGSSTQFSLATKVRKSVVPGLSPVPAFLGVTAPRS